MPAYILVSFTPKDEEIFKQYGASLPSTLMKYSGEIIVKGPVEILHGKCGFKNNIILSFPTRRDAYNWYNSREYQAIIAIRNDGMDSKFQLVG